MVYGLNLSKTDGATVAMVFIHNLDAVDPFSRPPLTTAASQLVHLIDPIYQISPLSYLDARSMSVNCGIMANFESFGMRTNIPYLPNPENFGDEFEPRIV